MATEPVLVTGAAGGQQGSTGLLVTRLLLERGQAVRAFVHHDDERAARLRALGAEVVIGDLREITSVLPSVRGVRRAFFTYQVTDGLLDATGAFAAAAREEGLQRVVEVSQLAASPEAPTPRMRQHWVAEQVSTGPASARCIFGRRSSSRTWPSSPRSAAASRRSPFASSPPRRNGRGEGSIPAQHS